VMESICSSARASLRLSRARYFQIASGRHALLAQGDAPSGRLRPLRCHALAAAFFHILGQRSHRFLRDRNAFTPVLRGVRFIKTGQKFSPPTLTFLPKRQGFLHHVFGTMQPPCADRLPDEFFLLRRKGYLHAKPS
jgi:hypothetical protein